MSYLRTRILEILRIYPNLPTDEIPPNQIDEGIYNKSNYQQAVCVRQKIAHVIEFLTPFADESFDKEFEALPEGFGRRLREALSGITGSLKRVIEDVISSSGNEMKELRDEDYFRALAAHITEHYAEAYSILLPLKSAVMFREVGPTKLAAAKEEYTELMMELESQRKELDKRKEEAEAFVATASNLGQLDTVIDYHSRYMKYWMFALGLTSLITLAILGQAFDLWDILKATGIGEEETQGILETPQMVMKTIGKIIMASFAIGLCVICSRNYQNHVHNFIINQHRKTSAVAFFQMYTNITSNDHKPDLVKHAMESIFAHSNTGFLSKHNADFQSLSPVVNELVKKIR